MLRMVFSREMNAPPFRWRLSRAYCSIQQSASLFISAFNVEFGAAVQQTSSTFQTIGGYLAHSFLSHWHLFLFGVAILVDDARGFLMFVRLRRLHSVHRRLESSSYRPRQSHRVVVRRQLKAGGLSRWAG